MVIEEKDNVSKLIRENDIGKLASKLDISRKTVRCWRRNKEVPSRDNFASIKEYYKGKRHICLWCEENFVPEDITQEFCSSKCIKKYEAWRKDNGDKFGVDSVESNVEEEKVREKETNAKEEIRAGMTLKKIQQIESWNVCPVCGKEFKSAQGVRNHEPPEHPKFDKFDHITKKRIEGIKRGYLDYTRPKELSKLFNLEVHNIRKLLKKEDVYEEGRRSKDYKNDNKKQEKKVCKYCGKEFMGGGNAKYCSERCSRLAQINPHYFTVFYRDHFRCRYCGKTPADGVKLTIDHVYPKSEGGTNQKLNVVTACKECNSHKSSTIWPKERIKEIWWQNKKLQNKAENLNFEEILEEFKNEYPDNSVPILQGGE